jgi:hypothetical protein
MLSDFKDDDLFSGRIVESEIENKIDAGQVEAIVFHGNNEFYIGSEGIKFGSSEYPARLFKVQITPVFRTVSPPFITTEPVVKIKAGELYSYDIDASSTPVAIYSLRVFPTEMRIDSASGLISWVPDIKGDYNVTVIASNGISSDANQSFTINVKARDCGHRGDLCEQGTQQPVLNAERKDAPTAYADRPVCADGAEKEQGTKYIVTNSICNDAPQIDNDRPLCGEGSVWQQGTSLCVPK